ncbi:MAG: GNAT family N-acetyltransferase, partial [Promethearchaeota archaeon]
DLLGVDEAAGIPPFYLKTFLKRFPKVIYATTTAGYEGTGRAFSVRFLHSIKNQKEYQTQQLELFEPIRYSKHDPVEQWLYRVLLLDAKPSKLTKEEINQFTISHPLSLREFTAEELFQQKNETLLRELMGIFVLAHYRNQPNDLALMADNPHYRIFGVMGEKGKIIAAIQIATEGKLNDHQKKQIDHGKDLDGHLIPVAGIKYLNLEFASLFGLRIIRIAVHPKLFRKGIGSLAIQTLEKQTHNEGIDWIGAAFGASKSLVNFWNSSNYSAINIRPSKLSSTGEHSLIVTKGISEEAKLTIEIGSRDFLLRFIDWLGVTLYDMEPDLALSIIEACPPNREFVPRITTTGVMRLQRYIWKQFYLLMVVDVVKELAWWYFTYKPQDVQLSESQKLLLLSLGVQGRNWGQTISHIHLPWEDVQGLLRNAVKKLLRTFLQTKDEGANSVP